MMTMKIDYRYNKIRPEWVLAYRARYNRWLKEPNRLVVWDVRNNVEKQLSVELPLVELLENFPPTLMALIDYIDNWKR